MAADRVGKHRRCDHKDFVTLLVTVLIVDLLEVIQIYHQQTKRLAVAGVTVN